MLFQEKDKGQTGFIHVDTVSEIFRMYEVSGWEIMLDLQRFQILKKILLPEFHLYENFYFIIKIQFNATLL